MSGLKFKVGTIHEDSFNESERPTKEQTFYSNCY